MIGNGGDDGRLDAPPATRPVVLDERALDTPNCPSCLTRMTIAETAGGEPYWACATCGHVALH